MTTSLVTGGAGFIGSHLVEFLVASGDHVIVLDDFSTGRLRNLAAVSKHDRLRIEEGSVLSYATVTRLVAGADRVFHLAASVGVDLIMRDAARAIEINVMGAEIVLRAARQHGASVFLASSSEVYGKSNNLPFREDQDLLLGPTSKSRWSYACAKAIDEFLGLAYQQAYGLPVCIARFFNTTGPRQSGRYGMVIPRFVQQALRGDPITVYGDGRQIRCFAHVDDIVPAVVQLCGCPAAQGEVVNLGSQHAIAIADLARLVKEMTSSTSPIVNVPFEAAHRPGFEDVPDRAPDLQKAQTLIGFHGTRTLETILQDVIRSCRETTDAGDDDTIQVAACGGECVPPRLDGHPVAR